MYCDPRFYQIWPKKWKNWLEKWVGLDEKMVLWRWNFGHGLSSSYYMIYVLWSKIRPNLTKKVKKLIRKMIGARWKNGPMTMKLWLSIVTVTDNVTHTVLCHVHWWYVSTFRPHCCCTHHPGRTPDRRPSSWGGRCRRSPRGPGWPPASCKSCLVLQYHQL